MSCPDGLSPGFGLSNHDARSICLVKSYFGVGSDGLGRYATGSGMLINSGPEKKYVITAGHNLFNHATRRNAKWTSVWFFRQGAASLATRDAVSIFTPVEFRNEMSPSGDTDFGVIRVNLLATDRFSGFTLATSTATVPTEKLIIGYPNEDSLHGVFRPYHATLTVEPSGPNNYRYSSQPTYEGMSGGPLLARNGDHIVCYGVHIRGGDFETKRAVRFSPEVMAQIESWL